MKPECPQCKSPLNEKELLSEPNIYINPMRLICYECGCNFTVKVINVSVDWEIKKE